jgi:hypothetical protein
MDVRIPGDAVDTAGQDLLAPSQELLRGLSLLPFAGEQKRAEGFSAALEGPPASVALIEAGATAFSKWWVAGAGASLLGVWGSVAKFYQSQQDGSTQRVLLWAAAITSAALILAIAYVINADLRGRAAVQVATVAARGAVAAAMLERARGTGVPGAAASADQTGTGPGSAPTATPDVVPLHWARAVTCSSAPADQEQGWHLLAMTPDQDAAKIRYLIAKDEQQRWVGSAEISF